MISLTCFRCHLWYSLETYGCLCTCCGNHRYWTESETLLHVHAYCECGTDTKLHHLCYHEWLRWCRVAETSKQPNSMLKIHFARWHFQQLCRIPFASFFRGSAQSLGCFSLSFTTMSCQAFVMSKFMDIGLSRAAFKPMLYFI